MHRHQFGQKRYSLLRNVTWYMRCRPESFSFVSSSCVVLLNKGGGVLSPSLTLPPYPGVSLQRAEKLIRTQRKRCLVLLARSFLLGCHLHTTSSPSSCRRVLRTRRFWRIAHPNTGRRSSACFNQVQHPLSTPLHSLVNAIRSFPNVAGLSGRRDAR